MPTIGSTFIEILSPTGRKAGTASGFFVRDSAGALHLITNRHVVTARHWQTDAIPGNAVAPSALRFTVPVARHDGRAGLWTQVATALGDADEQPLWLEHPRFGKNVDVVALPVGHLTHDRFGLGLDYVTYPIDQSPARLEIASDLFTIGFPLGFDAVEQLAFPVWTRGSIAWPPRLDWDDRPAFLIDARTRAGQSGSPVVFYADQKMLYLSQSGELTYGPAWGLVGIYTGRLHEDSDLGVVWKKSALQELLDHGSRPAALSVAELQIPISAAADPDMCPPTELVG